jgi:hypothetical protein
MLDFHTQAAAGNGQRVVARQICDEFHHARHGRQAVADDFLVAVRFPGNEFIAPIDGYGLAMADVQVFHDATVVQSQVVAVISFLADCPAFECGHFLGQLKYEGFTIYDNAIKIKDNGA